MTRRKKQKAELNLADYISLYRLAASPVIIAAMIFDLRLLTAWLLLISFASDAADGIVARAKHIETPRGAMLDSIGDTITGLLGLAAFIVFETEYFLNHFWIVVITVVLFLFQIAVALYRFGRATAFHTYLAKFTAVLVAFFLFTTILVEPFDFLFYLTFITAILEALEEIAITFVLRRPEQNVKGLYWLLKRPTFKFN
jgi:phosphatidylglycerophosphate synthase